MLELLFPKQADNNYLGYKLVIYLFVPFITHDVAISDSHVL